MVCSGDVDGIGYYFGLQTDVHNNNVNVSDPYTGKGLIFSRWKERNLVNARIPDDGFTESFHRRLQEYPLHARRERRCHL